MKAEIIHGMPFAEYAAIDAFNASMGKALLDSPARAKWERDNPGATDTRDRKWRQQLHAIVLEPERFKRAFGLGPDLTGCLTKEGKPAKNPAGTAEGERRIAQWYADNPGIEQIDQETMRLLEGMRDAIQASARAMEMLTGTHGDSEVTLLWKCPEFGIWCKARLDRMVRYSDLYGLVDLKSGGKVLTARVLAAIAYRLRYGMQLRHYLDGMTANRLPLALQPAGVLWVAGAPPYDVVPQYATEAFLSHGADELREAKRMYLECRQTGNWYGAAVLIGDSLDLPDWMLRRLEYDLGDLGLTGLEGGDE